LFWKRERGKGGFEKKKKKKQTRGPKHKQGPAKNWKKKMGTHDDPLWEKGEDAFNKNQKSGGKKKRNTKQVQRSIRGSKGGNELPGGGVKRLFWTKKGNTKQNGWEVATTKINIRGKTDQTRKEKDPQQPTWGGGLKNRGGWGLGKGDRPQDEQKREPLGTQPEKRCRKGKKKKKSERPKDRGGVVNQTRQRYRGPKNVPKAKHQSLL